MRLEPATQKAEGGCPTTELSLPVIAVVMTDVVVVVFFIVVVVSSLLFSLMMAFEIEYFRFLV